jgi:hypothetical protein
LIRVIASDGFNTTIAESGVFGVDMHPPSVSITSDPVVFENGQVRLEGYGYDPDEGPLPEERLVWASDRDGIVGSGQAVVTTQLTPGVHRLTLTGMDQDGNRVMANVSVTVPSR